MTGDSEKTEKKPFVFVLFGGTGDLAMRKLLPALYQAFRTNQLNQAGRIVGISRQSLDTESYREMVYEKLRAFLPAQDWNEECWKAFSNLIDYCGIDANRSEDYVLLKDKVRDLPEGGVLLYYLSTSPSLFGVICDQLKTHGLNIPESRIILEKPLGHDLASSQAINSIVSRVFHEHQIFRIDHYLGKESVQNLMALRFGNTIFEPLWRREWIDHVQITLSEEVGVETRGSFYENTGALRDMVQNHLLQLLCFVAMEPPASLNPDAIRDEKLRVLKALTPYTLQDIAKKTVRAQYRRGMMKGEPVPSYREEEGVYHESMTETFVALNARIANWRWADVPFFLRTGKRLRNRLSEIVIQFREVPHRLFQSPADFQTPNKLVIRLQPDEHIRLYMRAKQPGAGSRLYPVHLDLDFSESFGQRRPEAYERLLVDAIRGDLSLFVRQDELEQAWRWVEPIQEAWQDNIVPLKFYDAGTWGPSASTALLVKDQASWHEDQS